jgi:GMP synthase-like glutamine amidotransferase
MRVIIVQNCEVETLGVYEEYFAERKVGYDVVHAYRESIPSLQSYDVVLIGGTPDAVYHRDEFAYLTSVYEALRPAIELQIPCFGVCGGAQLLADLKGAAVYRNPVKEIGICEMTLTEAGRSDPLLAGFPERFPVFQWHGDTFDVPPGSLLLATGNDCKNQLFRDGGIVGVQFHLEASVSEAERWTQAYEDELNEVGKAGDDIVGDYRKIQQEMSKLAIMLMDNYVGILGSAT